MVLAGAAARVRSIIYARVNSRSHKVPEK
jgi:hypothetical protein